MWPGSACRVPWHATAGEAAVTETPSSGTTVPIGRPEVITRSTASALGPVTKRGTPRSVALHGRPGGAVEAARPAWLGPASRRLLAEAPHRSELATTRTELAAIAAPAIIGLSNPARPPECRPRCRRRPRRGCLDGGQCPAGQLDLLATWPRLLPITVRSAASTATPTANRVATAGDQAGLLIHAAGQIDEEALLAVLRSAADAAAALVPTKLSKCLSKAQGSSYSWRIPPRTSGDGNANTALDIVTTRPAATPHKNKTRLKYRTGAPASARRGSDPAAGPPPAAPRVPRSTAPWPRPC